MKPLRPGEVCCPDCGTIQETMFAPPIEPKVCRNCSHALGTNDVVCASCGKPVYSERGGLPKFFRALLTLVLVVIGLPVMIQAGATGGCAVANGSSSEWTPFLVFSAIVICGFLIMLAAILAIWRDPR